MGFPRLVAITFDSHNRLVGVDEKGDLWILMHDEKYPDWNTTPPHRWVRCTTRPEEK